MKLVSEKTKKIVIKIISVLITLLIIDIPLIIFIFISKLLIENMYYSNVIEDLHQSVSISALLLLVLPVLLYLVLRILLFIKNKTVKIIIHIISLIFIPISIMFYLYIFAGLLFTGLITSIPQAITPPISEYSTEVKKLTKKEYRIKHFPDEIPDNEQNYYFYVDGGGMSGYCIHYLQFNTNDKCLNNIIKQNRNKIYRKLPLDKVSEYYKDFDFIGKISTDDKVKYTVYILKNENNDNSYTSGFIISKELHEIIYFYADYNLEINRN